MEHDERPDEAHDLAAEHETAGFRTAFPLRPAATEGAGPLDGFDPDSVLDRYPPTWERFKRAARTAWRRLTTH
jgi:hypothetical protein